MTMAEYDRRLEGWLQQDDLEWDRTAQLAAVIFNAVTGKPADPRKFRPPRHLDRERGTQRRSVKDARADLEALKRELRQRGSKPQ